MTGSWTYSKQTTQSWIVGTAWDFFNFKVWWEFRYEGPYFLGVTHYSYGEGKNRKKTAVFFKKAMILYEKRKDIYSGLSSFFLLAGWLVRLDWMDRCLAGFVWLFVFRFQWLLYYFYLAFHYWLAFVRLRSKGVNAHYSYSEGICRRSIAT